jgi:outer membrane protein, multidrug efflux system
MQRHHRLALISDPRRSLGATCLVLALQGCVSMAPPATPTQSAIVPAVWSVADVNSVASATSLAQWWSRFDDPLLNTLVEQALLNNTGAESAQAALRQARALRDVAAAGLFPVVGSSGSVQHSTSGGHSNGTTFNAGVDASWEIDIFGVKRSALAASDATASASAVNLGNVRVSIAAEVALAYIALRNAQVRLNIANDNLASQLETLQIAQWRLQAGLVSSLEGEQARAAAEQTRAQLPLLQIAIVQAQHALAVLTGQPPASLLAALETTTPMPQARDELVLSLPAETLRQRPDVRAAELNIAAAMARVAGADAARLPSFKLSGSLGLNALTFGSLGNSAAIVSALLAGVSMPLFNGGALLAQVRAQQAALEQAQVAYRVVVLTALTEVEDALVAVRGDRERVARLMLAADAASNAALYARLRFSSGIVDFQTVLDTQRTQLSTQDSVVSARAAVLSDHVRLYKALGGGWLPDAAGNAPATTNLTGRTSSL